MLSVSEAQERIWGSVEPGGTEWVALPDALGRVLARDLAASRDQPPAPVSAMDGYAVRAADCLPGSRLRIVGEIAAGRPAPFTIGAGEAARIFTGGLVPAGADAILIQENARRDGDEVTVEEAPAAGVFIRRRGLDYQKGWIGLAAGTRLDARKLGLAAAMGHAWLPVRRRPRVGLLATGDELRWPGMPLEQHQINSSNSTCLAGLVTAWGGVPVDLGIAADDPGGLGRILAATGDLDIVVTSGGASVGDHDLVQAVAGEQGLELDFWKIAMRPGKPLIFGRMAGRPFLGMPGNPVSAAVCAILFLRGLMRRHAGLPPQPPVGHAVLEEPLSANGERQDYMRARLAQDGSGATTIRPSAGQDSSMFATFAAADALLIRPPRAPAAPAGETVPYLDLDRLCQG